jgi:hypothetical protein
MPTPAEDLSIHSNKPQVNEALGACISQVLAENPGMPQDQAVAICQSMASKATQGSSASRRE